MENERVLGEGATATVYEREGRAVKLYRGLSLAQVEDEARKQAFGHAAGLPVPRVLGVRGTGSGVELEMELVRGRELAELYLCGKISVERMIASLVELQARTHAICAAGKLPPLPGALAWKLERAPFILAQERQALLALLDRLDRGENKLCHGDLHPKNVLITQEGISYLIDWVDAASGDPRADACRSYLILWEADRGIAGKYLEGYCDMTAARKEDVLAWLPVVAGARLWEMADQKKANQLVALLRERLGV